ncbi:TnpZ protein, partial [human gut metagenome]
RIRKYSGAFNFPAISNPTGQRTIGEVAEAYSKEQVKYEPARHISKTLNEIDSMGQKTITGKMAISKEDYSQLTALAKEGITSRAEIKKFEQSAIITDRNIWTVQTHWKE